MQLTNETPTALLAELRNLACDCTAFQALKVISPPPGTTTRTSPYRAVHIFLHHDPRHFASPSPSQ